MIKGFNEWINESIDHDSLNRIKRLRSLGMISDEGYFKELAGYDESLAFSELNDLHDSGKINTVEYHDLIASSAINVNVRCELGVSANELEDYQLHELEDELNSIGISVEDKEGLPYNDELWILTGGFSNMIIALRALGWEPENETIKVLNND